MCFPLKYVHSDNTLNFCLAGFCVNIQDAFETCLCLLTLYYLRDVHGVLCCLFECLCELGNDVGMRF